MAKAKWPLLRKVSDVCLPLSGRPEAVAARFAVSPRGRCVAVFDALPPKDETDSKASLRVRVYSHEGDAFSLVLEQAPARTSLDDLDASRGRTAVSDTGVVAWVLGDSVHVALPDGSKRQLDAPGAFAFFDPIAPERLRLALRRRSGDDGASSDVIETYDTTSGTLLGTHPVGTLGGFAPQVDPKSGDVLLFDGWYAREDGAFTAIEQDQVGRVLQVGNTSLHLGDDVEDDAATFRRGRDGRPLPVSSSFLEFRRADVWRARAPMLASVDGRWLLSAHGGRVHLFDAERLEPQPVPAIPPEQTSIGAQVIALLDEHRAIAARFGLFLVDVRRGTPLGAGPVALLGLAVTDEHVVTLHEDGLRRDGSLVLGVAQPALDGLRLAPSGRIAAVLLADPGANFPVVVVDLERRAELARVEAVASVAWIDDEHLALVGAGGLRLLHVGSAEVAVAGELPAAACLGSDGRGRFFSSTDTTLIEHGADGAVRRTLTVPKKLKGYTFPSSLVVHGDDVFAIARSRLFRWGADGQCTRTNALENAVGGAKLDPRFTDGNLRGVAVSPSGEQLAVTVKTKHDTLAVVLCDLEGAIHGWSGPIFGRFCQHGERAFAAFRGRALVIATEHAAVATFELPA